MGYRKHQNAKESRKDSRSIRRQNITTSNLLRALHRLGVSRHTEPPPAKLRHIVMTLDRSMPGKSPLRCTMKSEHAPTPGLLATR
jgi:hypothetical protein